jgi:hypothetical protein
MIVGRRVCFQLSTCSRVEYKFYYIPSYRYITYIMLYIYMHKMHNKLHKVYNYAYIIYLKKILFFIIADSRSTRVNTELEFRRRQIVY